jgi:AcrR family transcriptional regulator
MLTAAPSRATTARRRRQGSSLTRQRILTAALHLFSTNGFTSTTVRDIARQAGITDAAIYYHFATKDELLRELVNAKLQPGQWIARGVLCADIRELVHEALDGATRVIEENHELLRIILRESLAGDPVAACRYGELLNDWESRLNSRLLPFESKGALAAGEGKMVARQIMYTIIMAYEDMLVLRPDATMTPAERRIQTLAFLWRHIDWLFSPTRAPGATPAAVAGRQGF